MFRQLAERLSRLATARRCGNAESHDLERFNRAGRDFADNSRHDKCRKHPPLASATVGLTSVTSTAAESNHVIKNSPGNLYGFEVTTGAAAGFVFVANSTTAPTAGGAAIVPIKCYVVSANSTLGVSFALARWRSRLESRLCSPHRLLHEHGERDGAVLGRCEVRILVRAGGGVATEVMCNGSNWVVM